MSFSGIFDPVVRTYFKQHFGDGGGDSGGAVDNDFVGFVIPKGVDPAQLESVLIDGDTLYKVSNFVARPDEVVDGALFVAEKYPLIRAISTNTDLIVHDLPLLVLVADEEGLSGIVQAGSGSTLMLFIPDSAASLFGFPSGGTWLFAYPGENAESLWEPVGKYDLWFAFRKRSVIL